MISIHSAILSLCLACCLCSCVTVLPARKEDDGSSSINASDAALLKPFSGQLALEPRDQIDIEYITAADIRKIAPKFKHTVVEVWATWCSHCYVNLSELQRLSHLLQEKDCAFVVVCQNINIPVMKRQLKKAGYTGRCYIIDPKEYGTDETKKHIMFCKELSTGYTHTFTGSVPLALVLDGKGVCTKVTNSEGVSALMKSF